MVGQPQDSALERLGEVRKPASTKSAVNLCSTLGCTTRVNSHGRVMWYELEARGDHAPAAAHASLIKRCDWISQRWRRVLYFVCFILQ